MMPMRRVGVVAVTAVSGVILLVWVITLVLDPAGKGTSGTGFDYRGTFYALSGAEVRTGSQRSLSRTGPSRTPPLRCGPSPGSTSTRP